MENERASDHVVEVDFGKSGDRPARRGGRAPESVGTPLRDIVRVLIGARWTIAFTTAAALCVALAYVFLAQQWYRAETTLQIEQRRDAVPGLEELSSVFTGAATPAETEVQVVRSRTVVGSAVDKLGLDIEVAPRRLPLLGNAIARRHRAQVPAPALLGLYQYAWGGERIRIERLAVPRELIDQPMVLEVLDAGRYRLTSEDGTELAQGVVGVRPSIGAGGARVELVIAELAARPGTSFTVVKHARTATVERLREDLVAAERGKNTGVIQVSLEGEDPEVVAATLNAITEAYLRRNVERMSAEAATTLAFIETQLPAIKANLDRAENALNVFQQERKTVNVSEETRALLDRSVAVERGLTELGLQQSEQRQRFTDQHPSMVSLTEKIERLRAERSALDAKLRQLPETELESARLTRDVKVSSELYVLLLNKAQELEITRSGVVGNVTVLDEAVAPLRPARPVPALIHAIALMLGLGLGVAIALLRSSLEHGADDPDEIEAGTGLPVFVRVPHSQKERRLERSARSAPERSRIALAEAAPGDPAIEALRILRTAIQFTRSGARNNVIALSAPAPGAGKSFVSVNLGHLVAAEGLRVVLVDGDLRRGRLHTYFALGREPGLSDVLSGAVALEPALRATGVSRMDLLPSGPIPANPSELLSSGRLAEILATLAQRYDLVIVDTPPALVVTDAALVARHAGVNLFVLRSGRHEMSEIVLAGRQFAQAGVKLQGAILNDASPDGRRYGRNVGPGSYDYGPEPG